MIWSIWALGASLVVSLISLVGAVVLIFSRRGLPKLTVGLVALAAGTLLGDAFIHLIPEIVGEPGWQRWVIWGMLVFFILEKVLHWRHCHEEGHHRNQLAEMSWTADSVHNLIDGLAIGASFLMGRVTGITTTIAIIAHEIPQEIGDFAVLIHSGMSAKKAVALNFISALASVAGVGIVVAWGKIGGAAILSGVTAGGFIYLAASDLIPELHRHDLGLKDSLGQLAMVLVGLGIMWWLAMAE